MSNKPQSIVDFNDKYSILLEEGHYGLIIEDQKVINYLDKLFSELTDFGIMFKYHQIKLKFGYPRFYSTLPASLNDAIESRIKEILDNKEE